MALENRAQVQVTLESRRVLAFLLVAAAACGAFFVLGVWVGKDMQSVEAKHEPPATLQAIDQREQAVAKPAPSDSDPTDAPPLVAPGTPPSQGAPSVPVAPLPAPGMAAPGAAPVVPAPAQLTPPAPKVDEAALKAQADEARKTEEARVKAERDAQAKAEKEAKEQAAKAEKEAKAKTEKEAKEKENAKPEEGGGYSLQFASYPAKEKAESVMKGFKPIDSRKPFLSTATVGGKTWYRIKIGHFKTREQAEAYQTLFEMKTPYRGKTMIVGY